MHKDRRIDNRTPMAVRWAALDDRHGLEMLVVVAKMTWAVSAQGVATIASPQSPVRFGDEPWRPEPGASTRFPTDLFVEKPGTDVLLVGTAHPPADRAVTEMDVSVRVETGRQTLSKVVRVYGPRTYIAGALGVVPGRPEPLGPTPLVYELAYGGRDDSDPLQPAAEPRNPVGRGFSRDWARLVGQPAPALEDPRYPLSSRAPAPAAFAPMASHWAPRQLLSGTFDARWRAERAPIAPADFDPRFNSVAPADLWSEEPLAGDEPIEIAGATAEGLWCFRLPPYRPVFRAAVRDASIEPPTHLDTLLIDSAERRVELTWRVAIPLPRKRQALGPITLFGEPALPESLVLELAQRIALQQQTGASPA